MFLPTHLMPLLIYLIILIILIAIFLIIFWLWMLIDCLSSKLDPLNKLLWAAIIVVLNIVGAFCYLIIVKKMKQGVLVMSKEDFKGKKLFRSKSNKMIAGVCGGIGEYFNIDPTVIRLIWVLLSIFTAVVPGIIAYMLCWIIIPQKK